MTLTEYFILKCSDSVTIRWISALDDSPLPEGHLKVEFPPGVNILLARVDDVVYAMRIAGQISKMIVKT